MGIKLVAYIRGGLGDIWPTVCALKSYTEKNKIKREEILILSDSVCYTMDDRGYIQYTTDMLKKLSDNIIIVPEEISGMSMVRPDMLKIRQNYNEFMCGRKEELKVFVKEHIKEDVIFIDSPYTECILKWNEKEKRNEDISEERKFINFDPPKEEKEKIDKMLENKHVLLHIRKRGSEEIDFDINIFNDLAKRCKENDIYTIGIGINTSKLSFEGMGYLITKSKVMFGIDSGFGIIKLYDQNKNNKLIMFNPNPIAWKNMKLSNKKMYESITTNIDDKNNIDNKNVDKIISKIKEVYK